MEPVFVFQLFLAAGVNIFENMAVRLLVVSLVIAVVLLAANRSPATPVAMVQQQLWDLPYGGAADAYAYPYAYPSGECERQESGSPLSLTTE